MTKSVLLAMVMEIEFVRHVGVYVSFLMVIQRKRAGNLVQDVAEVG